MSVGPDQVCGVVARTRHKMMQVELREAAARGAKFLEVRIDFLTKAVDFKRLLPFKGCPWLATFRRPVDGGRWPGTEPERQTLLRQAIVSGAFEWIDLETDIADGIRRFGPVKRVVSYHNTTATPENLDDIYDARLKQDADVYKIAVMPTKPDDLRRIVELQKRATKPTIAFGMGEFGFVTRFTSLKFGAPWIYAAFNKERGIAPGLPSMDDFRTTYPVRAIGPQTKFFALLGDPVGHSFSPILHNHMFRRKKVDAVYVPVRVPEEVYLVLRPHGGQSDYSTFLHELGHALHFAYASPDYPFEFRWLGDNSVTEAYAMLFDHRMQDRGWLLRYTSLGTNRVGKYLRAAGFEELHFLRRYCAKFLYERALYSGEVRWSELPDLYVSLLTKATGFEYDAADAFVDVDPGYYSARYLRAWQLQSILNEELTARFDVDWFRNPSAGPWIANELFAQGQRETAEEIATRAGGGTLSFQPLVRKIESLLA